MRDATAIRATIATIVTTAGALQTLIHETAIECLQHAQEHGDVTIIDALVKALPKGQRVESLIEWVQDYSPVRWNGAKEVGLLKKEAKAFTPFDIETAMTDPYYSHTAEQRSKQKLSLEALQNIVAGLSTRIEKAVENGTIKDGEDVDQMTAYASRLAGVNVPKLVVNNDEQSEDTPDVPTTDDDTPPVVEGEEPVLDGAATA